MFPGFTSSTRRALTCHAIDKHVVQTAQADPVKLIGRECRRITRPPRTRFQSGLLEKEAAGRQRRRIEITRDEHGIGRHTPGDACEDDPGRLKPRRLGQVEMGVVHAEKSIALSIAQTDPCADPLGAEERTLGWNTARRLKPKRAALKLFESPAIEEDRTIFAPRATIIATEADAAVADEQFLKFGNLFVQGLLYAKDVGCRSAQHRL